MNDNYLLQDEETGATRKDHVNNLKALPFVAQLYGKAEGEHEDVKIEDTQQMKDERRMEQERREEDMDDDVAPAAAAPAPPAAAAPPPAAAAAPPDGDGAADGDGNQGHPVIARPVPPLRGNGGALPPVPLPRGMNREDIVERRQEIAIGQGPRRRARGRPRGSKGPFRGHGATPGRPGEYQEKGGEDEATPRRKAKEDVSVKIRQIFQRKKE